MYLILLYAELQKMLIYLEPISVFRVSSQLKKDVTELILTETGTMSMKSMKQNRVGI